MALKHCMVGAEIDALELERAFGWLLYLIILPALPTVIQSSTIATFDVVISFYVGFILLPTDGDGSRARSIISTRIKDTIDPDLQGHGGLFRKIFFSAAVDWKRAPAKICVLWWSTVEVDHLDDS